MSNGGPAGGWRDLTVLGKAGRKTDMRPADGTHIMVF